MTISFDQHWEQLTPEEQAAIRKYKNSDPTLTGLFTYELNKKLRCGATLTTDEENVCRLLDQALRFTSDTELVVYRATDDAADLLGTPIGEEHVLLGYSSTCASIGRICQHLKGDGGPNSVPAILNIRVPPSVPVFYVDSYAAFGGSEREFLLPRRLRVKLTARVKVPMKKFDSYVARRLPEIEEASLDAIGVAN
jgi:hypothetical protein